MTILSCMDPQFGKFFDYSTNPGFYHLAFSILGGGALSVVAHDIYRKFRPSRKTINAALADLREIKADTTSSPADKYIGLMEILHLPKIPEVDEFRSGLEVEIGRIIDGEIKTAVSQVQFGPNHLPDLEKLSPTLKHVREQVGIIEGSYSQDLDCPFW